MRKPDHSNTTPASTTLAGTSAGQPAAEPQTDPTAGKTAAAVATADAAQDAPRAGRRRRIPLWGRLLLGLACAVLVLAAAVFLYVNGKLDLIQYHDGSVDSVGTIDADEDQDLDTTGLVENTDEMVMPEGSPFEDSDVLNILLISTDERTDAVNDWDAFTHLDELDGTSSTTEFSEDARADSLILVSLNIREDTIKLVSIERATGVPILLDGYEGEYDWITHTFRYGGAKLTMETVEDCFNVAVDHYVRINFNSFVQIVDAVGGVDINLTEEEAAALNWEVPSNSMLIVNKVTPGLNHMDGYTALQYARLRAIDSDWMRIQRQRTVIQAVLDQIKSASPLELNTLLDTVLPLVQTNFTKSEIAALLVQLPGFLGVTAEQMSLPAQGTYGVRTGMDNRQMYDPDWAENIAILHDFLYDEDSDSDTYPRGQTVETALGDYTGEQLEDFGAYLAANTLAVNLTDGSGLWPTDADFARLETPESGAGPGRTDAESGSAMDQTRVWLLGDDFTAAAGAQVRQAMVQQLADAGVRCLLTEDSMAGGVLLDAYITGGDEALLDLYTDLQETDVTDLQREFYTWLRAFNSNRRPREQLHLLGLGPDTSPRMTAAALALLRSPSAVPNAETEDIDYWLRQSAVQPTVTAGEYLLLRLEQEQGSSDTLASLFGDSLPLADLLADNAGASASFRDGTGTEGQRARQMYENFCRFEDLLPEDACFLGDFSLKMASATALTERGEDEYQTFAALLESSRSPVAGQVQAVGVLYLAEDVNRALPNDRTFDYPLLQACAPDALTGCSWLRLDGADSPFASRVPLFQPGEEDIPPAADYFPALLTVPAG